MIPLPWVTFFAILIESCGMNYTQPILVYPEKVHGEKELLECETNQVCNLVYRRLGFPTRAERQCRCKAPSECQAHWHANADNVTYTVNSRLQFKLCTGASALKNCTKKERTLNFADKLEGLIFKRAMILLCKCPSFYFLQQEPENGNITCSRMRTSKEGEVCGYVRTDLFATHYVGSCSAGQKCLARDKRTHQRQLLFYHGPVYTARCAGDAAVQLVSVNPKGRMIQPLLSLSVKNKLAVVTIQRTQKKNALNKAMYDELTSILNDLSEREDVTISVITGAGDFFCSGNDLLDRLMDTSDVQIAIDAGRESVRKFVEAFINHKKILVAVVNGPAVGIAVTILPLCDVVYCSSLAWFQTPFTKLGICAEAASTYTFPRIMGKSKANDMLLFNKRVSADEALLSGLVSKVFKPEYVEDVVWQELRRNAAQLSFKSLQATKKLMRRFETDKLHVANMNELMELRHLFLSEECQQALLQFMSRRSHL